MCKDQVPSLKKVATYMERYDIRAKKVITNRKNLKISVKFRQ